MTRTRSANFMRGLATGYVFLGVNILYTAASIPLGLHFLGREQFGIWALAQQISGYFILLDLGMSSAVSRLIADKKSDVAGRDYGSLFATGGLVLLLQAMAVALAGAWLAHYAPLLFSVPNEFGDSFRNTLLILALVSALSLGQRILGFPLWAFQRMDVVNLCASASLLLSLLTMGLGLISGLGIYSLAFAGLPGVFLTAVISFRTCQSRGYYPSTPFWDLRPSWNHLKACLNFGKDVFVIGLGSQWANASQIMVISKFIGLEAAAVFSVATKIFFLAQQLCMKIVQSSVSGLTEIFIQEGRSLFLKRALDLFAVVGSLAGWAACGLILLNGGVIDFWTSGKIRFSTTGDILLGFLLIPASLTFVAIECFVAMGSLKSIRFLRLGEGAFILLGSLAVAGSWGMNGVLAICLLAACLALGFSCFCMARSLPGTGPALLGLLSKVAILLLGTSAFRVFILPLWENEHLRLLFSFFMLAAAAVIIFLTIVPIPLRNELYRRQKTLFHRNS